MLEKSDRSTDVHLAFYYLLRHKFNSIWNVIDRPDFNATEAFSASHLKMENEGVRYQFINN